MSCYIIIERTDEYDANTKRKKHSRDLSELKENNLVLQKLDEAIEDVKQGRVQSLDEAWEEIDAI